MAIFPTNIRLHSLFGFYSDEKMRLSNPIDPTGQECDHSRKSTRKEPRTDDFRFRLRIKGTAVGTKTLRRGSSENWHWTNARGWLDVIFSNVREWRTTDGQKYTAPMRNCHVLCRTDYYYCTLNRASLR